MTLEQLKVLITAETSGLNRELKKVQKSLVSLERDVEKSNKRISKSYKSLFKGISFAAISAGLLKVGQSAIQLASDLQEVQNVVDVTFGEAKEEIEDFAKTAITQFGLSELQAKRMASTFMAMSNSMGVANKKGAEMAITLAGLAGDLASFYNTSVDMADTALQSVYTGETESLKKYGIVMTEANLKAYALTQGITKQYSAMSQAEKIMLRYNYVLHSSAQAQGDFARTSGSWANQIRILSVQWQTLLGVMGQGLVAVLTPVVKALNQMLASLIAIANAIAKAFGGTAIKNASASVSSSASGAGDLADNFGAVGDNIDGANASAKKLQKTIASFDELNVLNSQSSGGGGSSTGGLGDTSGSVSGTPTVDTEEVMPKTAFQKYLEEIANIFKKWKDTIPKLEFNFDKEKAIADLKQIGLNIANIIAGWGSFVISIGIKIANDLDIGALTNSFLGLVESATGLASAITDVLVPAFNTFYDVGLSKFVQWIGSIFKDGMDSAKKKLDEWKAWWQDEENKQLVHKFAENLGIAVSHLADIIIAIGDASWAVFKVTLEGIDNALTNIAENLLRLDATQLQGLGAVAVVVGTSLWAINTGLKIIGTDLFKAFKTSKTFGDFFLAFEEGAKEFLEHCKLIKKDTIKGFGPLAGVIKGFETAVVGGMTNAGNAIINFVSHPIQALKTGFNTLLTHIKGIPAVFTTVFGAITHPINTLKTAFTGLVTASGTFAEGLAMAVTGGATKAGGALALLKGAFTKLFTVIKAHPIGVFIAVVGTLIATMIEAYNTNDEFKASITDLWENHVKPLADKFGDFVNAIMDLIDVLSKAFFTLIGFITGDVVTGWSGAFTAIWKVVEPIIAGIFDLLSAVLEILTGIIQFLTGVFTGDWEKCWTGAKKVFEGAMNGMKTIARTVINTILGFFQKLVNGAKKALDFVKKAKNYNGTGNATINPPVIPKLATGGVIKSPTVAMIGEYAGASHNPEIVTPQSLLQSTIESSNKGIIDALIQQTKQVLVALEGVNMEVSIGDETIAQSAKRGNQSYYKRTGKPLFI